MVILAILYGFLVWLVFSKVKLVRWGWLSGTVAVMIGAAILGSFLAFLNTYAPSGPMLVSGRVVGVPPTVSGRGQIAASGMLARVGSIGGVGACAAAMTDAGAIGTIAGLFSGGSVHLAYL
jgi:hypothetical protein